MSGQAVENATRFNPSERALRAKNPRGGRGFYGVRKLSVQLVDAGSTVSEGLLLPPRVLGTAR